MDKVHLNEPKHLTPTHAQLIGQRAPPEHWAEWVARCECETLDRQQAVNHATYIKLRAERRAGELLAQMDKAKGTLLRGPVAKPRGTAPRLRDLGISKMASHRWQVIAALEPAGFERAVAETGDRL